MGGPQPRAPPRLVRTSSTAAAPLRATPAPCLQAELGVGDCGGLRYIPGMTKSGVQKRPEWLEGLGQQLGLVEGAK